MSQPAAAASGLHAAALGGRSVWGLRPLAVLRRRAARGGVAGPERRCGCSFRRETLPSRGLPGGLPAPSPAPDGGPPCVVGPGREAFPAAMAVEGKAWSGKPPKRALPGPGLRTLPAAPPLPRRAPLFLMGAASAVGGAPLPSR